MPILRGRDFTDAEGWSRTPVAVINQTMAQRHWPDADPIGRRFRMPDIEGAGDWFTVIGVARDRRLFGIDPSNSQPPASAFVPYAYQQVMGTGLTIRVTGDPASITSVTRAEIRASDSEISTYWIRTMDDVRRMSFYVSSPTGPTVYKPLSRRENTILETFGENDGSTSSPSADVIRNGSPPAVDCTQMSNHEMRHGIVLAILCWTSIY